MRVFTREFQSLQKSFGNRRPGDVALVGELQSQRRTQWVVAGPQARLVDEKAETAELAAAPALQAGGRILEEKQFRGDMIGWIAFIEDSEGNRIGIQEPGGFADLLSRSVLRAAKIDPKDVNFVTIASEDVPALVANQVDTAILHVEQEMFAKTKVPDLHAIARMWELQPKTLYTFLSATEKTIKDHPDVVQKVVAANIEATRIMYTERAKIIPILVKQTGYPENVLAESFDFLVKQCIWDANSGLSPERVNFTAELMTKVGNIKEGKTPTYDDVVDTSFAKKAIEQLGEWKGPVCPTAAF